MEEGVSDVLQEGEEGQPPATCTAWISEEMARMHQDEHAPTFLVYRTQGDGMVRFQNAEELASLGQQWHALETFWKRLCTRKHEKTNIFSHTFQDLDAFEQVLESHLWQRLSHHLSEHDTTQERAPFWQAGSPFRGLQRFRRAYAPLFFGRERAQKEMIEQWVRRVDAGSAFLLLLGASGTGKSSLIRAGILPHLPLVGLFSGIGWWRYGFFWPGKADENLWTGLAKALLHEDALPELAWAGSTAAQLGKQWRDSPERGDVTFQMAIQRAQPDAPLRKKGRLVLVVDQLEALFTLPSITPEEREAFIVLLTSLARSGVVWVIGAMRSDLYHYTAELPGLCHLMAGEGTYHLLPPEPEEMAQMIQKPAALAGLTFEEETTTGRTLDAILLEDATRVSMPLPPLAFVLNELYLLDVAKTNRRVLTVSSYQALGGLQGAIARQAEHVFHKDLEKVDLASALPVVLRTLMHLNPKDKTATAHSTRILKIAITSERSLVLKRLVQKYFVIIDGDKKGASARLVHEALFHYWPRMQKLVEEERCFLEARDRLEKASALWLEKGRHVEDLLPGDRRLAEGEAYLFQRRHELTPETALFIEHSSTQERLAQVALRRDQAQLVRAQEQAEALANFILFNLWNQLRPLGRLDLLNPAAFKALDYFEQQGDIALLGVEQLQRRATAVISLGDVLVTQGHVKKAMKGYQKGVEIFRHLALNHPDDSEWQRLLSVGHEKLGNIFRSQRNLPSALAEFRALLETSERLVQLDPANTEKQRDLWVSHNKVGEVLRDMGDLDGALTQHRASLAISEQLTRQNLLNVGWQRDLSISHTLIGDVLNAQGDWVNALSANRAALVIRERLAKQDPNNSQCQRDRCVSHIKIGDVLQAQDKQAEALAEYRADLDIRAQLVQQDPGNVFWQQGLAVSHERVGLMLAMQESFQEAIEHFRQEIVIVEAAYAKFPDQKPFPYDLKVPQKHLADLLLKVCGQEKGRGKGGVRRTEKKRKKLGK